MSLNLKKSNRPKPVLILILALLIAGCGIIGRKDSAKEVPVLTINRLWEMHEDVNFVYYYYEDGSVVGGLLLRWDADSVKIQKRDADLPELIPAEGIVSVKAVVGNRIWQSLAVGAALGAAYFGLVNAGDLGGESLGTAMLKMFGAPLIIMTSVVYGASSEKTETYAVPGDFKFNYEEIRKIHQYIE